ncbi:MAG: phosphoribosylanthranilate isomerase [Thermoleophilia bacterium]|nr:phosphoribosylanthranilate isomerase [Thermoleophilia bacterium]
MAPAVKVKICGLTRPQDAALAAELGAWALGVIFAPESPRRISIERAAEVMGAAPAGIARVGVFVNADIAEIAEAVEACGLTAVQLHGDESPAECQAVRERTGVPVIKAIAVSGPESLERVVQFDTDYVLLDTYHPERRGGTGEVFDWSMPAALDEGFRRERLILAGGLNPGNILEAIQKTGSFAVDVSSGVESAPGIKDPDKLRMLFAKLEKEVE